MIKAIMAMDLANGVGKNGTIPWPRDKEDLNQFKNKTTGHIVVMGYNTYADPMMPKPLKGRTNIVVTHNPDKVLGTRGIYACITGNVILSILEYAKGDQDVWIIGGPGLLNQCWPVVEELHLTRIPGDFNCDNHLVFPVDGYTLIQYDVSTSGNEYFVYKRFV